MELSNIIKRSPDTPYFMYLRGLWGLKSWGFPLQASMEPTATFQKRAGPDDEGFTLVGGGYPLNLQPSISPQTHREQRSLLLILENLPGYELATVQG